MRDELKKLEGKKLKYKATFSQFGKIENNRNSLAEQTILLKEVYQGTKLVAEHVWVKSNTDFEMLTYNTPLKEGVILEFTAVARPYPKDALFKATGLAHDLQIDSTLTEIQNIKIV